MVIFATSASVFTGSPVTLTQTAIVDPLQAAALNKQALFANVSPETERIEIDATLASLVGFENAR